MPLIQSGSKSAVRQNISEMIRSGHPRAQAIAAALSTARKYAAGGSYLAGTAGSPVDLSALTGAYRPTAPAQTGILPSGLMATPQVGSFQLDPTTGALTPETQAALRTLAQRGLTIAGQTPPPATPTAPPPIDPFLADLLARIGNIGGGVDREITEPTGGMSADRGDITSESRNSARGGAFASGGSPPAPYFARSEARTMDHPSGLVMSPIGGRSDHIPMHLGSGSYVIPADVVSGMGQGNTLAGAHQFDKMIHSGPFGTSLPKPKLGGTFPKPSGMPRMVASRHFARGGRMRGRVPVIVAGGERICSPEECARIGGGDVKKGHAMLDRWVVEARKHIVKHTKALPGPVGAKK